jgi:hypothetical protein
MAIDIPSWVIPGDSEDYVARKQGYKSHYDMQHTQAVSHYMNTKDYSKLQDFYARYHPHMGTADALGVPRAY